MTARLPTQSDTRRWLAYGLGRLAARLARRRAEAELRAMDERELRDLALDRGGIVYVVQRGRER
ncbi:MAG: hypothetical protein HGA75_14510 [Thiobacillus sp.]|nr:hypothetical protein [Thiobacillus sp.]